jgi:hypothetical protein
MWGALSDERTGLSFVAVMNSSGQSQSYTLPELELHSSKESELHSNIQSQSYTLAESQSYNLTFRVRVTL